jgi:hypothetical protein
VTPEIRAFEFALGLFTVLIGLAIADVATSFHRLVRDTTEVRWDPLPLISALFALVVTVGMWFDLWGIRHATSVRHFFLYLGLVGAFAVLFLIAASSLPDDPSGAVDLRTFYERNRRYFWLLVTLFEVIYVAFGVFFMSSVFGKVPPAFIAMLVVQWLALILIPLTLSLVRARWVHYLGLALLFAVVLWHYGSYSIT